MAAVSALPMNPLAPRITTLRAIVTSIKCPVHGEHEVVTDTLMDFRFEKGLGDRAAEIHGEIPWLIGEIETNRQRGIAEGFVAVVGRAPGQIETWARDVPFHPVTRKWHGSLEMRGVSPGTSRSRPRGAKKGSDVRIGRAVVESA